MTAAGDWRDLVGLLRHPLCQGMGPIQLLSHMDFWDESDLPFQFAGGGTVCHLVPEPGFRKEALAGSRDEQLLIVDCPDDDGWIVPEDIMASWMARQVSCPALDDLLLAHPLYEYLTRTDEKGHARGGGRGELVQWAPGIPNLASVYAPEFLPGDPDAPAINRDRDAYADAVMDLLEQLERRFDLIEMEVSLRFGQPPLPVGEEGEGEEGDEEGEPDVLRVEVQGEAAGKGERGEGEGEGEEGPEPGQEGEGERGR